MKKFHKTIILGVLLLSLTLVISACTSGETSLLQHDLSLQVAGEGEIRNSAGNTLISSENTTILDKKKFKVDRDSTISLNAVSASDNDFLFWAGKISNFNRANNSVYMNSDKDLIAVFGGDEVFMAGYITESDMTTDVTGYWKALGEPSSDLDYYVNTDLEIYLNQKNQSNETYRYIKGDGYDEGLIRAIPDGSGSQYIAAVEKIELSDRFDFGDEVSSYLFVYIHIGGFEALIIPDYHPEINTIRTDFNEITKLSSPDEEEKFINEVKDIIDVYNDEDLIKGKTFIIPTS